MKNRKQNTYGIIIGVAVLTLLIAVLVFCYDRFREKPVSGEKEITIEVINQAGESLEYSLKTNAEYLIGAMEEAEGLTFIFQDSGSGPMLEYVNDERAVWNLDNAFWAIQVNGEDGNYGIDSQPIKAGDHFQLIYTELD